MPFHKYSKRIFVRTFSFVLGSCLAVITLLTAGTFLMLDAEYREEIEERLTSSSHFLASAVENSDNFEAIIRVSKNFASRTNIRTTIISAEKGLIFDSEEIPVGVPLRAHAPEVSSALSGKPFFVKRPSYVLGIDMFYLAIPAGKREDGSYSYCIRVALPAHDLSYARETILQQLAGLVLTAIVLAVVIAYVIALKAGDPINKLKIAAQEFAAGNFDWPLENTGLSEMVELGKSMKEMANQLKERIDSINSINAELNEVFSMMSEPLFICAEDGAILRMNRTAMNFFKTFPVEGIFKNYTEVFKEEKLLSAIKKTFSTSLPTSFDIEFPERQKRTMAVMGIRMPKDQNGKVRTLFIMHDISAIRALESQRREFIASVSHELRTPITAILGAAETMTDSENLDNVKRFAGIIEKAAVRMNMLVDDMVLLSRVESNEYQAKKFFKDSNIAEILDEAIAIHEIQAEHHNNALQKNYPSEIAGYVDRTLLTIAVSNLIDNAIKYNPDGTSIEVSSRQVGNRLDISVSDNGNGVDPKCAKRIFERFYRCEKGRELNPGGSGIGLAIVKHIAIMHNGNAELSSGPGKGSTFTISIIL